MMSMQGYTAHQYNTTKKPDHYTIVAILTFDNELYLQDFQECMEAHLEHIAFYTRYWKNVKREEFLHPILTPWISQKKRMY